MFRGKLCSCSPLPSLPSAPPTAAQVGRRGWLSDCLSLFHRSCQVLRQLCHLHLLPFLVDRCFWRCLTLRCRLVSHSPPPLPPPPPRPPHPLCLSLPYLPTGHVSHQSWPQVTNSVFLFPSPLCPSPCVPLSPPNGPLSPAGLPLVPETRQTLPRSPPPPPHCSTDLGTMAESCSPAASFSAFERTAFVWSCLTPPSLLAHLPSASCWWGSLHLCSNETTSALELCSHWFLLP